MTRLSEQVKASVSLRRLAERAGVAWDPRKSAPRRGDWWAPCPFHAERSASFHVLEPAGAGGFFKCFGCGRKGSAIDFVIEAEGVPVREALRRLASSAGIDREDTAAAARRAEAHARARAAAEAEDAERAARGLEAARWIWRQTEPAGPLLESYLAARGVDLAAIGGVPASLRFAPALEHWAHGADTRRARPLHVGPAMVAAIGRGALVGVHRTWIAAEGRARLPDGAKVGKKMIGRTGAIFGAPVRLSTSRLGVVVGEGIETTLAAWSALVRAGLGGRWGAEAALSLGALAGPGDPRGKGPAGPDGYPLPSPRPDLGARVPHWLPAEGVRAALILGEGSAKGGGEAARRFAERARAKLAARGFEAEVRVPGGRWDLEADFADLAAAEAARVAPER
ncbi:DUF7146 domain-containing protein [Amaricoccus solimangrovi]|uniref:Zinc finger CHC2-type domain-containing protein n=1 Tax=Amaricoccus solimangrovi TaxID=2589815 RepID=A0A501WWT4_9RHOB|nr:CHC2 zinc finger domain-containing protein [Amaricoccus solimangrovi]TPE52604.1 hypothetical protein FJM51_05345 [Amaricoccus solimangrovi]